MPRINLLPWREELRQLRQKNFGLSALGAVLGGIAVIVSAMGYYSSRIEYQNDRNKYLTNEIATLDKQITEIQELESLKNRLVARMEIVEDLQTKRPEVVHLFDELARAIPDGVRLNSISQSGNNVTISGVAQASTRVSAFMRQIDNSDWLTRPDLTVVETTADDDGRSATFTIVARQTTPKSNTSEESK